MEGYLTIWLNVMALLEHAEMGSLSLDRFLSRPLDHREFQAHYGIKASTSSNTVEFNRPSHLLSSLADI